MKEDYDGAEPCANSVSAMNLLRLSQLSGNESYREYAQKIFLAFMDALTETPVMMPYMVSAVALYLAKPKQIIIVGEKNAADTKAMLAELHKNCIVYIVAIVYFRNRPWIIVLFSLSENKTIIHGLLRK